LRNLRQFEIAIEIEKYGSISKAADALRIAQPTLSKLLQKTERELGLELFDRTTVPIKLTPAGEKYIAAGRKIIDADHQLQKELDEIRTNRSGVVKIGISPSRAPYIMPDIIQKFKSINPEGKVVIKEKTTSQLNAELLRGDLDLIISLLSDGTRGFAQEDLFNESILLAVPQPMVELDALDILRSQPIINIGKGQRMWKVMNSILDYVGGAEPVIECQSIESALALVKKGFGAMIVPSYIVEYGNDNQNEVVFFKELPNEVGKQIGAELERKVCIFYRKEQFLTSAEKAFIEACKIATAGEGAKVRL